MVQANPQAFQTTLDKNGRIIKAVPRPGYSTDLGYLYLNGAQIYADPASWQGAPSGNSPAYHAPVYSAPARWASKPTTGYVAVEDQHDEIVYMRSDLGQQYLDGTDDGGYARLNTRGNADYSSRTTRR